MISSFIETRPIAQADRQRIWKIAYREMLFVTTTFLFALALVIAISLYASRIDGNPMTSGHFWPVIALVTGMWFFFVAVIGFSYRELLKQIHEIHIIRGKIENVKAHRRGPVYYTIGKDRVAASIMLSGTKNGSWVEMHCYQYKKVFYKTYYMKSPSAKQTQRHDNQLGDSM